MAGSTKTAEAARLEESTSRSVHWKRWGPYLSERQWGTVREDYSEFGTAWDYFPHEQARSRVYLRTYVRESRVGRAAAARRSSS